MAPSPGHLMVPKTLRFIRLALDQAKSSFRSRVSGLVSSTQHSSAAHQSRRIPIPSAAAYRQSHSLAFTRWFSSTSKSSITKAAKHNRSSLPVSRTSRAISQKGLSPFASTLRPNLTGGAIPRSAGGYSLGGGARHFSHTSGCQAQVLQNVNAGIRAFFVNGGKARYDGVDSVSGNPKWRRVGQAEDEAYRQWQKQTTGMFGNTAQREQRGTSLDFQIRPNITALMPSLYSGFTNPANSFDEQTLQDPHLLPALSADLARAVSEYAQITHDLYLLSRFGDLPLSLHYNTDSTTGSKACGGPTIRVRFAGCDGETVRAMCTEVGIKQGIIREDEGWRERDMDQDVMMSLRFPSVPLPAPTTQSHPFENHGRRRAMGIANEGSAHGSGSDDIGQVYFGRSNRVDPQDLSNEITSLTSSSLSLNLASGQSTGYSDVEREIDASPANIPSGNTHYHVSSPSHPAYGNDMFDGDNDSECWSQSTLDRHSPSLLGPRSRSRSQDEEEREEYEGMEGIYRFMRECDEAANHPSRRL